MRTILFSPCSLVALLGLAAVAVGADAPATFKVSEFTFTRPDGWEWVESTSAMRKAQLKVTDAAKKEIGEVVFFHFGEGGGGGTQANIERWLGQFQEPNDKLNSKIEEVTIGKHKVTHVQAEGTYLSGTPGGPKTPLPNHVLLGAIIESAQGNVFIRFTAPANLGKASREAFRKMVESALK